MIGLFLAQNKCRSKVQKETTPKLNIKISLTAHSAKLGLAKKFGS
jgi:hypothetical protein